jgi:hemerythrin-like domain-containing protein
MATNAKAAASKPAAKKKAPAKKRAPARKKPPASKKAAARKRPAQAKSSASRKAAAAKGKGVAAKKSSSRAVKMSEQPLMKALRAEHRHIAGVMELFGDQLKAIDNGQLVDTHVVYEIMDYMVSWPDRYHHPREDMIYGRVAELDGAAADEVDTLQRDHDANAKRGRVVLAEIERWREGEVSGAAVVKAGRGYIDHLYEHMNLEEKLVFPHIETVLTTEDWRELAEDDQLRPVSDPVFGPRVQREYRNLTRKLRRNVRRGVEKGTMVEWISIEAMMESLEVMSMAVEAARNSAEDHVRAALDDARDLFKESLAAAPILCAVNNVKLSYRLLEDLGGISRDALDDLGRVNQERRDRIRLLDR